MSEKQLSKIPYVTLKAADAVIIKTNSNAGIYMYGYHLFFFNIPLGKGVLDCDYL